MAADWSRPVVHWEIQAKDAEKMSAFYSGVFNWEFSPGRVKNISPGFGAPDPITGHLLQADKSGIVLYIQVMDLAESLGRCAAAGGKVLREPFVPPGGGASLAWAEDPEGNRIVLVQQ